MLVFATNSAVRERLATIFVIGIGAGMAACSSSGDPSRAESALNAVSDDSTSNADGDDESAPSDPEHPEHPEPNDPASGGATEADAGEPPAEVPVECGGAIPDTVVLDVPWVGQNPELARGCEVTSLSMVLRHAGIDADKMSLAQKIDRVPYTKDGLSGNPNDGFVGDMVTFSRPGYGVYHAPIERLAELYLPGRVLALTGANFDDLLGQHVARHRPVWIVTNATFKKLDPSAFTTWHTSSGDVPITWHEHSVVITGYDPDFVYVNDPLDTHKNKKLPRKDFREAWEQMGRQAISYQNCGYPAVAPGGGCRVRADAKLYCDNAANAAMYAEPSSSSEVVNHLRSSFSWFQCWGTGELHAGGNTTWYRTLGDDNLAVGWVPAVKLKTQGSFDANPSADGLPHCE